MLIATIAGNTFFEAQQRGLPQWISIALGIVAMLGAFVVKGMASPTIETDTDLD